jgi:hypothetical protein
MSFELRFNSVVGVGIVLSVVALAKATTPTYSQESIDPFPISEVSPGVYVHFGANELMNAQNAGAIASLRLAAMPLRSSIPAAVSAKAAHFEKRCSDSLTKKSSMS